MSTRHKVILITAFLFFLSTSLCPAQEKEKKEIDREKTIRSMEDITGRKAGSQTIPDNLKILRGVKPSDGFQYFSGYYRTVHNHPAIYASGSGKDERLNVVGANISIDFPMTEAAKAFEFYIQLLKERGYRPQK